jgi:hypothetical protein
MSHFGFVIAGISLGILGGFILVSCSLSFLSFSTQRLLYLRCLLLYNIISSSCSRRPPRCCFLGSVDPHQRFSPLEPLLQAPTPTPTIPFVPCGILATRPLESQPTNQPSGSQREVGIQSEIQRGRNNRAVQSKVRCQRLHSSTVSRLR